MSFTKSIYGMKSLVAGLILSTGIVSTSCIDDLDAPTLPPTAYVSIYQGSPDAPAMDIYANANLVTRIPIQYSQVMAYNPFYTGKRDFRFSEYNSATSLLEKEFTLDADSVYSMFIINEKASLDAILVKDEWEEPNAEKAQIRLAHISPDTEEVYLVVNEGTSPTISEINYKDVSEFIELPKGNTTLTIKSKTTNETLLTSGTLDLKGNRIYTLVIKGLKSETTGDKKLDIQLITNYISY